MNAFITPPDHFHFTAKKLFDECGELLNGAIAHIEPNGGGPLTPHLHPDHDHLFIIVSGTIVIRTPQGEQHYAANDSVRVCGTVLHSMWNDGTEPAVVVGLTLRPAAQ